MFIGRFDLWAMRQNIAMHSSSWNQLHLAGESLACCSLNLYFVIFFLIKHIILFYNWGLFPNFNLCFRNKFDSRAVVSLQENCAWHRTSHSEKGVTRVRTRRFPYAGWSIHVIVLWLLSHVVMLDISTLKWHGFAFYVIWISWILVSFCTSTILFRTWNHCESCFVQCSATGVELCRKTLEKVKWVVLNSVIWYVLPYISLWWLCLVICR